MTTCLPSEPFFLNDTKWVLGPEWKTFTWHSHKYLESRKLNKRQGLYSGGTTLTPREVNHKGQSRTPRRSVFGGWCRKELEALDKSICTWIAEGMEGKDEWETKENYWWPEKSPRGPLVQSTCNPRNFHLTSYILVNFVCSEIYTFLPVVAFLRKFLIFQLRN